MYRDIAKSVKAQDFDSCISLVRVQLSLPDKIPKPIAGFGILSFMHISHPGGQTNPEIKEKG